MSILSPKKFSMGILYEESYKIQNMHSHWIIKYFNWRKKLKFVCYSLFPRKQILRYKSA